MIELVIVISLIGILYAVIIAPNTRNTAEIATVETAAKQLRSDLSLIRSRAMDSGKKQRALIVVGASQLTLYEESPSTNTWISLGQSLPFFKGVQISGTTLSSSLIIFGTNATPYNDPLTDLPNAVNSEIGSAQTITLRSGTLTKTLRIEPQTGYVSID